METKRREKPKRLSGCIDCCYFVSIDYYYSPHRKGEDTLSISTYFTWKWKNYGVLQLSIKSMYALHAVGRLRFAHKSCKESNTDRNSNTSCPFIGQLYYPVSKVWQRSARPHALLKKHALLCGGASSVAYCAFHHMHHVAILPKRVWTVEPSSINLDNGYDKDLVARRILPTFAFFVLQAICLAYNITSTLIDITALSLMLLSPFTDEQHHEGYWEQFTLNPKTRCS